MVVDKEDKVRPEIGNARALAIYAHAHARPPRLPVLAVNR